MQSVPTLLDASTKRRLSDDEVRSIAREADFDALIAQAGRLRDQGHGDVISYSRKVFIPLTHLCRDVCHYCTFAHPPRKGARGYLSPEEVLEIARAGQRAGCREALFTLGDKPELRYSAAREELARLGHPTTLSYLAQMCELVLRETSLLPHVNPGVMTREEIAMLRASLRLAGNHAGEHLRASVREGRSALRVARQGAGSPAGDTALRWRTESPVHHRHPDRDRRDARGADRFAARDPCAARGARPHPGSDHPELPRQVRHEDGGRAGTWARRA